MPRGNPQNITELNAKRTPQERKEAAAKAGKASGEARRNYANLRECFKQRMTPEMMEEAYDTLWKMFTKDKNLMAYDRLHDAVDDGSSVQNNVTITFASEDMDSYGN